MAISANEFKPASYYAARMGVKSLLFGPPGGGKTPLLNSAPRPALFATEPGLLSMRGSNVPTIPAYEPSKIKDVFDWLKGSAEVRNYDTICIDSVSQLAEIILNDRLPKEKDPRRAYGVMHQTVMQYMNQLYFMQQKHVVLIAKMGTEEENVISTTGPMQITNVVRKRKPYFPGQALSIDVPHLYDEILYVTRGSVPGVIGERTPYIRCQETDTIYARDRSGMLCEYEPQDLTALFKKAMS